MPATMTIFQRAMAEYLRSGAIAGFSGGDGSDTDNDAGEDDQDDRDDQSGKQSADDDLGEKGREAIRREREARKAAEKERGDLKKRLDDLEAKQREAEESKAKEEGRYKELLDQREADLQKLKADLAERDRQALRSKAAAKYRLPDDLASRLIGETEADIEADAKALAKLVNPEAADTEAGAGRRGGGGPKIGHVPPAKPGKSDDEKPPAYAFIPAGAVRIPDGV